MKTPNIDRLRKVGVTPDLFVLLSCIVVYSFSLFHIHFVLSVVKYSNDVIGNNNCETYPEPHIILKKHLLKLL